MSESQAEDGLHSANDDYGVMHKLVLQGIMSAGYLDAKGVKNLFIGVCNFLKLSEDERIQRTQMMYVQKVVREINERIKPFDMAIRSASCELTGKKYYIFLVTVEKPVMKFQSMFTKSELALFQKIMNLVMRKYRNFAVPVAVCINLASEIDARNFSKVSAEDFVDRMINYQYFAKYYDKPSKKPEDYEITLGVRTIREFEPILREDYDDVMKNCTLCKTIMLHGFKCPKCDQYVHKACLLKYVQSVVKTCPGCKNTWEEKKMIKRVHEDAEPGESDADEEIPAKRHSGRKTQTAAEGSSSSGSKSKQNEEVPEMPVLTCQVPQSEASPSKRRGKSQPSQPKGSQGTPATGKPKRTRAAKRLSSSEEDE